MNDKEQVLFESMARQDRVRQSELVRLAVSRISRGNVNLQRGHYITECDKQRIRDRVFSYVIKAPI